MPQPTSSVKPALHASARWYAKHGWKVFPLRPLTKQPFAKLGVYSATTDLDQIDQWWRQWPQANIGLNCGGSGLLALDFDTYKDSYEGDKLLTSADEQTITSLTGGGGTHLLYAQPEGAPYTNATGNLPPGIDIRGRGGYIVLPPSVHPSGNGYAWEIGYGPQDIPPLPIPAALQVTLDKAHRPRRMVSTVHTGCSPLALRMVQEMIDGLELDADGPQPYGEKGAKWILKHCPFQPRDQPHETDGAAFIIVSDDFPLPLASCHHARCKQALAGRSGWSILVHQLQSRKNTSP